MEEEIKQLKYDMATIKSEEMKRIFKEFLVNDYERRFKVTLDIVLKALVGNDNLFFEMNNYKKEFYVKILM